MRTPFIKIIIALFVINTLGPIPVQADNFILPKPGVMVHLSPAYNPPTLRGLKVDPQNPMRFDFILDQGDSLPLEGRAREGVNQEQLKTEAQRLIKYFLASVTVPEADLWVNLSPYEKNRIIPDAFGKSEMGRDLLAQDYMLKQITASLIYPEDELGKEFWKRVYAKAAKDYGTTNIPINTFNKVWIMPDKAVVYEKEGIAYIENSSLNVMLEQDYLALDKNSLPLEGRAREGVNKSNALGSQIVRELILPELTKEVNQGKNFAQLRQIYNSLILATWYKRKLKESLLAQVYADKNKVKGLSSPNVLIGDPGKSDIEHIYHQYLQAIKKGAFNYLKEEADPITREVVPRKYFSGGCKLGEPRIDRGMGTNISNKAQTVLISANITEMTSPARIHALSPATPAQTADPATVSNPFQAKTLSRYPLIDQIKMINRSFLPPRYLDDIERVLSWVPKERLKELDFKIYPAWHPKAFWLSFLLVEGDASTQRNGPIRINAGLDRQRFRYLLIHELTHILTNGRPDIERRITEKVMPKDGLPRLGEWVASIYSAVNYREFVAELVACLVLNGGRHITQDQIRIITSEIFNVDASDFHFPKIHEKFFGLGDAFTIASFLHLGALGLGYLDRHYALFASGVFLGAHYLGSTSSPSIKMLEVNKINRFYMAFMKKVHKGSALGSVLMAALFVASFSITGLDIKRYQENKKKDPPKYEFTVRFLSSEEGSVDFFEGTRNKGKVLKEGNTKQVKGLKKRIIDVDEKFRGTVSYEHVGSSSPKYVAATLKMLYEFYGIKDTVDNIYNEMQKDKINLDEHARRRGFDVKVVDLEERYSKELQTRGDYWNINRIINSLTNGHPVINYNQFPNDRMIVDIITGVKLEPKWFNVSVVDPDGGLGRYSTMHEYGPIAKYKTVSGVEVVDYVVPYKFNYLIFISPKATNAPVSLKPVNPSLNNKKDKAQLTPASPAQTVIQRMQKRGLEWDHVFTYPDGTMEGLDKSENVVWASFKHNGKDIDIVDDVRFDPGNFQVWFGKKRIDAEAYPESGFQWEINDDNELHVITFYLKDGVQGQGIGLKIMQWLLRYAQRRGIKKYRNHSTYNPNMMRLHLQMLNLESNVRFVVSRKEVRKEVGKEDLLSTIHNFDFISPVDQSRHEIIIQASVKEGGGLEVSLDGNPAKFLRRDPRTKIDAYIIYSQVLKDEITIQIIDQVDIKVFGEKKKYPVRYFKNVTISGELRQVASKAQSSESPTTYAKARFEGDEIVIEYFGSGKQGSKVIPINEAISPYVLYLLQQLWMETNDLKHRESIISKYHFVQDFIFWGGRTGSTQSILGRHEQLDVHLLGTYFSDKKSISVADVAASDGITTVDFLKAAKSRGKEVSIDASDLMLTMRSVKIDNQIAFFDTDGQAIAYADEGYPVKAYVDGRRNPKFVQMYEDSRFKDLYDRGDYFEFDRVNPAVKEYQAKYPDAQLAFQELDITRNGLPAQQYDLVRVGNLIQHMEEHDQQQMMVHASNGVKDGGYLLVIEEGSYMLWQRKGNDFNLIYCDDSLRFRFKSEYGLYPGISETGDFVQLTPTSPTQTPDPTAVAGSTNQAMLIPHRVIHEGVEVLSDATGQPYFLKVPQVEDDWRGVLGDGWPVQQRKNYIFMLKQLKSSLGLLEPKVQEKIATGKALIIGPGNHPYEILRIFDLLPNIESLTVIDINQLNLDDIQGVLRDIGFPQHLFQKINFKFEYIGRDSLSDIKLPRDYFDFVYADGVFDYNLIGGLSRMDVGEKSKIIGNMLNAVRAVTTQMGVFISQGVLPSVVNDFRKSGFYLMGLNGEEVISGSLFAVKSSDVFRKIPKSPAQTADPAVKPATAAKSEDRAMMHAIDEQMAAIKARAQDYLLPLLGEIDAIDINQIIAPERRALNPLEGPSWEYYINHKEMSNGDFKDVLLYLRLFWEKHGLSQYLENPYYWLTSKLSGEYDAERFRLFSSMVVNAARSDMSEAWKLSLYFVGVNLGPHLRMSRDLHENELLNNGQMGLLDCDLMIDHLLVLIDKYIEIVNQNDEVPQELLLGIASLIDPQLYPEFSNKVHIRNSPKLREKLIDKLKKKDGKLIEKLYREIIGLSKVNVPSDWYSLGWREPWFIAPEAKRVVGSKVDELMAFRARKLRSTDQNVKKAYLKVLNDDLRLLGLWEVKDAPEDGIIGTSHAQPAGVDVAAEVKPIDSAMVHENEEDKYFDFIYSAIKKRNPQVDKEALYEVAKGIIKLHIEEFRSPNGVIVVSSRVEEWIHTQGGTEDKVKTINSLFIRFLREQIGIPYVYHLKRAFWNWADVYHHIDQHYEESYVGPKEFDALLRFCVYAGFERLQGLLMKPIDRLKDIEQITNLLKEKGVADPQVDAFLVQIYPIVLSIAPDINIRTLFETYLSNKEDSFRDSFIRTLARMQESNLINLQSVFDAIYPFPEVQERMDGLKPRYAISFAFLCKYLQPQDPGKLLEVYKRMYVGKEWSAYIVPDLSSGNITLKLTKIGHSDVQEQEFSEEGEFQFIPGVRYSRAISSGYDGSADAGKHSYETVETVEYANVPVDAVDFIRFYHAVPRDVFNSLYTRPGDRLKYEMENEVRVLGEGIPDNSWGGKERGFRILEKLGLPYPRGIALSEKFVQKFSTSADVSNNKEIIIKILARAGVNLKEQRVSVRSNPKQSMPGILFTQTNVGEWGLLEAIESVDRSWFSDKAYQYRKALGIKDDYDLPIIIQEWKSGKSPDEAYFEKRKKDPALPLYASGVFSTRNPNTNEPGMWGRYKINANGEELMTEGQLGENIEGLAQEAPGIYQQLLDAKARLEEAVGPQEVEFVINNGKLYFLQTRDINFSPQAKITYLQELLAVGKITEARAIPLIEELQKKVGNRKVFKIKEGAVLKVVAKAKASTPGAFQGYVVWRSWAAQEYIKNGKPVIFLIRNKEEAEELLPLVFQYPQSAVITGYGNDSSHEAVLTRLAGVSSLINVNLEEAMHEVLDLQKISREWPQGLWQDIVEHGYVTEDGNLTPKYFKKFKLQMDKELQGLVRKYQETKEGKGLQYVYNISSLFLYFQKYGKHWVPIVDEDKVHVLYQGDQVVIDGDKGILYEAPNENVLEEENVILDASHGINIPTMKTEFLKAYLDEAGKIKSEFTVERLEKLNEGAVVRFREHEAIGDKKAAFVANLEKHFLHELLRQRQSSDKAMTEKGGIDLTKGDKALEVKRGSDSGVKFNIDPAMIEQLKNVQGFVPVIINVQPITDLRKFLGLTETPFR